MMEKKTGGAVVGQRSTWKGWVEIGGKRFYAKSNYERKYALYLELMKTHKHIVDWEYEPHTFYFQGIIRGTNNYKPDFKVYFPNGTHEWIEIKGYMEKKDFTKMKRMAKYFPNEKIRVIGKPWFTENNPKLRGIIKDW